MVNDCYDINYATMVIIMMMIICIVAKIMAIIIMIIKMMQINHDNGICEVDTIVTKTRRV